jgi:Acyltransferase C-terminus
VYDVTLGYQEDDDAERNVTPDFVSTLLTPSATPRVVAVHQRRIPLEEVPEDEEELKAWIYRLYAEKDKLLDEFARTGAFPGRKVQWVRMPPRMLAESHAMFWAAFVVIGSVLLKVRGLLGSM